MTEPATPTFLRWSESALTFDRTTHPESVPQLGRYLLVVDPIISMKRLTKVLMDRGSGLNIVYAKMLDAICIDRSRAFPWHRAWKAGHATWAEQSAYHLWGSIQL